MSFDEGTTIFIQIFRLRTTPTPLMLTGEQKVTSTLLKTKATADHAGLSQLLDQWKELTLRKPENLFRFLSKTWSTALSLRATTVVRMVFKNFSIFLINLTVLRRNII